MINRYQRTKRTDKNSNKRGANDYDSAARERVADHRRNGETLDVLVTCRLDTAEDVSIYEAGGVLQRFAQDFLESKRAAAPV